MIEYSGPLMYRKMPEEIRKIYGKYSSQRQRCYDKKCKKYPWYGAKGIGVEYTSREFINWYLKEIKNFKGSCPSVGRINHNKNYSFDNIRIEDVSDNSRERIYRAGNPKPGKLIEVIDAKTGEIVAVAKSNAEAALIASVSQCNVSGYCSGKYKSTRSGLTFRYR